jgi:hypothetical protein
MKSIPVAAFLCSLWAGALSLPSFANDTAASPAQDRQLFNLFERDPKPRFKVTDISWPAKVGEAEICLWRDDKLAALSLTVDDNSAGDIPWWKEQAARYGFPVTWFIITERVGTGPNWGTWEGFAALDKDAGGHAVESHSVTHLHSTEPGWKGIEWEYAESKRQIEEHLPGKQVSVIAYPGGPNTKLNDPAVAARYYRVGRGTRGMPNSANQIDYLSVSAMSSVSIGDPKAEWADVNTLVDPARFRGRFYRGWAVYLQHGVPQAQKDKLQPLFDFIEAHKDALWLGLFADVAKYGQERDTATLKVVEAGDKKIRLELSDRMDDAYFTYPLTVKVRVPDAWTTVSARQAGRECRARLVVREGARYALVDVTPDAGVAEVSP